MIKPFLWERAKRIGYGGHALHGGMMMDFRGLWKKKSATDTADSRINQVEPNEQSTLSSSDEQALIIAEAEAELLDKKGFYKLLESDFCAPVELTARDLRNIDKTRDKLISVLFGITEYLGLPSHVGISIEYDDGQRSFGSTQAGSYRSTYTKKEIHLRIHKNYKPANIMAILCHECTHYFMEYNHLNWQDTKLNEVRTDVTANLIGFNRIMENGYRPIVTIDDYGSGHQISHTQKVGYITAESCAEIGRFLRQYRKKKIQSAKDALLREAEEEHLASSIKSANDLFFQLKNMNLRNLSVQSQEGILRVQQALMEYESRDLEREISDCAALLNSGKDLQQLQKAGKAIETICTDMLNWISAFQSE